MTFSGTTGGRAARAREAARIAEVNRRLGVCDVCEHCLRVGYSPAPGDRACELILNETETDLCGEEYWRLIQAGQDYGPDGRWQAAEGESSRPRRSLQDARIPNDAPPEVKDLVATREKECVKCQHCSGVCTREFPQARGCGSIERYRAGWLGYCAREHNHCPDGRW